MSSIGYLTILSIALAVCCGVVFKVVYPMVQIDGKLAGLFAFVGVGAALLIFALCKMVAGNQKKKSAP